MIHYLLLFVDDFWLNLSPVLWRNFSILLEENSLLMLFASRRYLVRIISKR